MESLALMPKYESYKESGAEWLGDIPDSWELLSNKHIFTLKKKLVGKRSADYDLLSLTLRGIIKRDMDNPEGKFPAEFNTYQEVNCGDFVFCLFDVEETPRTVGLSSYDGMITGAYTVFQTNAGFDNKFLYYFYLNLDSTKRLKPLYRGLRNTIPKDSFMSFKTFVPLLGQQTLIANFLDKKTAQIDDAIAIKEQQISLLKERKQIIIQQAVTQGLDPNVPMKDSGVDWIGKIPEHWDCAKLKYYIDILPGYAFKSEQYSLKESDIKLLRGINVSPDLVKWEEVVYWPSSKVKGLERYDLQEGDLVIAMDRPWVSSGIRVAEISKKDLPCMLLQRVGRIRRNDGSITSYIKVLLSTNLFLSYFEPMLTGISVPHISSDQIEDFRTPIPPLQEQREILDFVNRQINYFDQAIQNTLQQIEKLKEYKTTLINSAVTGKIKITPDMVEQ